MMGGNSLARTAILGAAESHIRLDAIHPDHNSKQRRRKEGSIKVLGVTQCPFGSAA